MKRKLATIGLALVTAIVLAAGHPDSTILIDNFNDGVDDGWDHEDSTIGKPWGPAIYDASSGAYHLQSSGRVRVDDPSVGTIDSHWKPSENVSKFSSGVLRGKFRADTWGSTVGFLLRTNDTAEAQTDYGFYGSTSFGTFYIERFNVKANPSAPQTIIAMADPRRFRFAPGETWNVEAGVVGDRIWMKAWRDGHREPTTPMLSLTDDGLGPDSGSAVCVITMLDPVPLMAAGVKKVRVSGTFDDITFTPAFKR